MNWGQVGQLGIAIFGLTAVFCTQAGIPRLVRYAPILGLAAQPFWLTHFARNLQEEWGVFVVCVVYTFIWGFGFWRQWVKPWRAKRVASETWTAHSLAHAVLDEMKKDE